MGRGISLPIDRAGRTMSVGAGHAEQSQQNAATRRDERTDHDGIMSRSGSPASSPGLPVG